MIGPKDLTIAELKQMHKSVREKIACAKDVKSNNKWITALKPDYNPIIAEGRVVLRSIDDELDKRGYDVKKLFKGYIPNE